MGRSVRMSQTAHLDGFLPGDHALSPRWQYPQLKSLAGWLASYPQIDLWDTDLARLPKPLAAIRLKARQFAQQHMAPLASEIDLTPHWPVGSCPSALQALLAEAGRQGWLSYFLPKPIGSMPWRALAHAPVWQSALVVEEFTRVCGGLMLFVSAHHLGCMPIVMSGDVGQILRFLAPVYRSCLAGRPQLMAFAITEPGAGSDVEEGHGASHYKPGVVARAVPGGYVLNGRKCYISGGDLAHSLTVFAALEGEGMDSWTCFRVTADSPGFKPVRTELKMGMRASGAAELEFADVFVSADQVIGGLRQGWALNRATLNFSRIPVGAMGVGFARAATETALTFARRYQLGGKALIHYQDVQMQLATMVAETRAMRSLIWQEARHSWRPRQLHAALCKFQVTDRAQAVCEMAMDILGDHGGLHEQGIEKILRDVRLTRIFEGTNQINRLSLIEDWQGQLMQDDNGAPHRMGV